MSAHPARPRALVRIRLGLLDAAAATADVAGNAALAHKLWAAADDAWKQTPREEASTQDG